MPGHWSERPDPRVEKDPNRDAQLAKKHLERAYRQAKKHNESQAAKKD